MMLIQSLMWIRISVIFIEPLNKSNITIVYKSVSASVVKLVVE